MPLATITSKTTLTVGYTWNEISNAIKQYLTDVNFGTLHQERDDATLKYLVLSRLGVFYEIRITKTSGLISHRLHTNYNLTTNVGDFSTATRNTMTPTTTLPLRFATVQDDDFLGLLIWQDTTAVDKSALLGLFNPQTYIAPEFTGYPQVFMFDSGQQALQNVYGLPNGRNPYNLGSASGGSFYCTRNISTNQAPNILTGEREIITGINYHVDDASQRSTIAFTLNSNWASIASGSYGVGSKAITGDGKQYYQLSRGSNINTLALRIV